LPYLVQVLITSLSGLSERHDSDRDALDLVEENLIVARDAARRDPGSGI
jgi:hypothetical protein